MKYLILLLTISLCYSAQVMAIFAHPDDDVTIPMTLARINAEDALKVVYVTSGKNGSDLTDYGISKDALGLKRESESIAALGVLGIQPSQIVFLRQDDNVGVQATISGLLYNEIVSHNTEVVLGFGPDGIYGHDDHVKVWYAFQKILDYTNLKMVLNMAVSVNRNLACGSIITPNPIPNSRINYTFGTVDLYVNGILITDVSQFHYDYISKYQSQFQPSKMVTLSYLIGEWYMKEEFILERIRRDLNLIAPDFNSLIGVAQ